MSNAVSKSTGSAPRDAANVIVAKNIKAELALAGLNQVDLANHLDQNEMWLSRRMKSTPPFSTNEVADVADFFGIDVGELFRSRERRAGAAAGQMRKLYMLEPTTQTVEDRRFDSDWVAPVTQLRTA